MLLRWRQASLHWQASGMVHRLHEAARLSHDKEVLVNRKHLLRAIMPRTLLRWCLTGKARGLPACLSRPAQAGQTMAEFALAMPILAALFVGLALAGFYAFRAASADWGVFITGVAEGSYNTPATAQVRRSIIWPDIRSRIATGQAAPRQVRSQIIIEDSRPWILNINLIEAHRGSAFFRLWRFYPGPPPPGGPE